MRRKPTSAVIIVLLLWLLVQQCIITPAVSVKLEKTNHKFVVSGQNTDNSGTKQKQFDRINFAPFILRKRLLPSTFNSNNNINNNYNKALEKKALWQVLPVVFALIKNSAAAFENNKMGIDSVEEETVDNVMYSDCSGEDSQM
ncbi:hypothetical protein TYRP_003050 [Tyrophagus putrescentiae]|nr:hypothetical protein TYRP_003050 [Tyrophagus putrescentiae]